MPGQSRRSVRREIRTAERGLRELQREVGESVTWYEPSLASSTVNSVYDEGPGLGPGLVYRSGRDVPAIWIRYQSPSIVATDDGEYTLSHISFRVTANAMRRSGLAAPLDADHHFNDRFSYNGFLYRVESFSPKGWLMGTYLMVDVTGRQLKADELMTDAYPFWEVASTAHTQADSLDWPDVARINRDTQPGI